MEDIELYCIGYSGRDKEKTWEHIEELKKIGVPEPKTIPELYHLKNNLLTNEKAIQVIGDQTSGEVEIVLISESDGSLYVTVGSDHTDRGLETVSIHKSKQICDKPIASDKWRMDDVEKEWDELELYAEVQKDGEWIKYQEGKVSSIIPLREIKHFLSENNAELNRAVVFCGTVPLLNGFIYGDAYRCGIRNNKMNSSIELEYEIKKLKE
ncbi:DUF2848 family protein [Lentibacillus sp. N15]|uniref:DUF2848 family protein n=1 Tax=Lentibacillus songyuanensis TaxID=3136161 RepID=UPI0031BA7C55